MGSIPNILEGARKALDKANDFTKSITGDKPNVFAPKSAVKPERTDYSHAREARGGEFLGVKSDQAPELKSALDNREQAKKALEQ